MGLRLVCMWPGLPGTWYRGRAFELCAALAAAWLAVLLMLATFVWPHWFSVAVVRLLWSASLLGWLIAAIWEHIRFPSWFTTIPQQATSAFSLAQQEYLKGNWFASEAQLLTILHENSEDAEALLLLVSVLRRTGRLQPAMRRLQQLELLDAAIRWRHEMGTERRLLERALVDSGAGAPDAGLEPLDEATRPDDALAEETAAVGTTAEMPSQQNG